MPHQKLSHIENNEQGFEPEQANTIKADGGQLFDQEILNEYCREQIGLASVPESFKSADENDSWQL